MPRTEAGALVGLATAAALVHVLSQSPGPAAVERRYDVALVLVLFVALLLGCAAVLLSRATCGILLAVPWRAAATGLLRWVGFAGVVLYAAYVAGDVRKEPPPPPPEEEVMSVGKVSAALLLFLVFLAGILTVNLSMLMGRGSEPPPHCCRWWWRRRRKSSLSAGRPTVMLPCR